MLSHTHHTCVYPFNERGHVTNINQLGQKQAILGEGNIIIKEYKEAISSLQTY